MMYCVLLCEAFVLDRLDQYRTVPVPGTGTVPVLGMEMVPAPGPGMVPVPGTRTVLLPGTGMIPVPVYIEGINFVFDGSLYRSVRLRG